MSQPIAPTIQIPHSDIIRLILQYLQQSSLPLSFHQLQSQSHTTLNLTSASQLQHLLCSSAYPQLFQHLNYLTLSHGTLFQLYEYICDDLIDSDAFVAAGFVLKQCVLGDERMVGEFKERVLRLEYICQDGARKGMYHRRPTEDRRRAVVERVLRETYQGVESGRLLGLLTAGLRYEYGKGVVVPGVGFSVMEGKSKKLDSEVEHMVTVPEKVLKYSPETRITSLSFSTQGHLLALGGIDGLIQLYSPLTYTLQTSTLPYQAQGLMLYHQNPIQHLKFAPSDQLLASIDSKGTAKIWNTTTGRLLRKIQTNNTINCCAWGMDAGHFLTGWQKTSLYGIRGCNILKQYGQPGDGYLLQLFTSQSPIGSNRIYTFTHTGIIKVYNYQTQQIITTTKCKQQPIVKVHQTRLPEQMYYVCTEGAVFVLNGGLEQVRRWEMEEGWGLGNVGVGGRFVYEWVAKQGRGDGKGKDGKVEEYKLQVRENGRIVHARAVEGEGRIMTLQPRRNLLVTYDGQDGLSFWRA